jgi:hypothetical protein
MEKWVVDNHYNHLSSSYITFMSRTNKYMSSRKVLTYILLNSDSKKYSDVTGIMRVLHASGRDYDICINEIKRVSLEEQLLLIPKYVLELPDLTQDDNVYKWISNLLDKTPSLAQIDIKKQNSLFERLLKTKKILALKVLEHQIRASILSSNNKDYSLPKSLLFKFKENLGFDLFSVTKVNLIISYIDYLPQKDLGDLFAWLLKSPLSDLPKLPYLKSQPLNSRAIQNEASWLFTDLTVRYYLYRYFIESKKITIQDNQK